eukprot:jgi/Botrbrau1/9186/Bobra.0236s0016.2
MDVDGTPTGPAPAGSPAVPTAATQAVPSPPPSAPSGTAKGDLRSPPTVGPSASKAVTPSSPAITAKALAETSPLLTETKAHAEAAGATTAALPAPKSAAQSGPSLVRQKGFIPLAPKTARADLPRQTAGDGPPQPPKEQAGSAAPAAPRVPAAGGLKGLLKQFGKPPSGLTPNKNLAAPQGGFAPRGGLVPLPKPKVGMKRPLGLGGLSLLLPNKKRPREDTAPLTLVPPAGLGFTSREDGKAFGKGPPASRSPNQLPGASPWGSEGPFAWKRKLKPDALVEVKPLRGPHYRRCFITDLTGTSVGQRTVPRAARGAAAASGQEEADHQPGADLPSRTAWTDLELSLVSTGVRMFGGDACRIARLVGSKSCRDVSDCLAKHPEWKRHVSEAPHKPSALKQRPLLVKSKMSLKLAAKRRHGGVLMDLWGEYKPCKCKEVCDETCSCFKSLNFCDKFCACPPKCSLRFVGCKCTSGCKTKTCPCSASGRECDPDLCQNCCIWAEGGEGLSVPTRICTNMGMLLRQHKRIAVGLSNVSGWGAFVLEGVRKNELVGEYTGELIGHEEAERRGKAYDRDNNSYLFNLNSALVIDARQRGNKIRYANHGEDANCRAEILMVDGDHRVGIYAVKDIPCGSELFYNYNYDRLLSPPSWAKKGRKVSKNNYLVTAKFGARD